MKTKTTFLVFLLSVIYFPVSAQQTVSWDRLKDVTWSQKYVASLSGYYQMPDFGKQIELLDNKPVIIQGFYVPVDVDGTIFALSETPSYMCFFCGVGGIESVMEIFVKEGHRDLKRVRTDRYIQVKGIFSINRDDPEHLMYLLKDAELVKVIR
ncbi:hypothetical protein [uncultured Proteiniphilum sp.]|uniref:hypothetical protein n=1 Tax=uncultured Proteiniphilum sp. TaxID=497637 RepID=UPI00261D57B9|nr:hypothetical protein [uncultured Proteiniphilum sp.]